MKSSERMSGRIFSSADLRAPRPTKRIRGNERGYYAIEDRQSPEDIKGVRTAIEATMRKAVDLGFNPDYFLDDPVEQSRYNDWIDISLLHYEMIMNDPRKPMLKWCIYGEHETEFNNFPRSQKNPDKLTEVCIPCRNKREAIYRKARKERAIK